MPAPHGGKLINRVVSEEEGEKILASLDKVPSLTLNFEQVRDLENIAFGVFSPLEGYLTKKELENVLYHMRLPDDTAWTIPIVLDLTEEEKIAIGSSETVALRNENGKAVGFVEVEEVYSFNKEKFAQQVYGTLDTSHPGVAKTLAMKDYLIGGKIGLILETEDEFGRFRLRPIETRVLFKEKGWRQVAGFQTRNVPHLGHEYLQKTALTFVDGIFINPIIGKKKEGDFKDEVILEAYQALIDHYYLKERAILAIFRTEMRYAGPREAIFHAIVRKNFGCSHFIVGRDHAGVGNFYPPFAAQEIFDDFPDLGIVPIFFNSFYHCEKCGGVVNEKTCPHPDDLHLSFSGTRIREMLEKGEVPPPQIMRQEVAEIILRYDNPFVS
jgi:sulfate adenylyltransferase